MDQKILDLIKKPIQINIIKPIYYCAGNPVGAQKSPLVSD